MLRDIDINDKCSIQIEQIIEGEEGSVVWDSGLVLLDYFNKHKEFVNNKIILELGSGTGIVGIGLAHLGVSTINLTDRSSMINLLNNNKIRNIKSCNCCNNFNDTIDISILDWSNEEDIENHITKDIDIIIASDVIYGNSPSLSLLSLLQRFLYTNKKITIYLSYEQRHRHNEEILLNRDYSKEFFDLLSEDNNLKVDKIPLSDQGEYCCDEISIWKISNKSI
jgi:predicted nicotinamide N-methyase